MNLDQFFLLRKTESSTAFGRKNGFNSKIKKNVMKQNGVYEYLYSYIRNKYQKVIRIHT